MVDFAKLAEKKRLEKECSAEPNVDEIFAEASDLLDAEQVNARRLKEASSVPATTVNATPVPQADSEALFEAYAREREVFLETPYLHNTSIARNGAAFTVIKAYERDVEQENDDGKLETREVFTYIVDLQEEYIHEDRKTTVTTVRYPGRYLLQIDQGEGFAARIRRGDFNRIQSILKDHGAIPNLTLNEVETDDASKNNALSIIHKNQWRHIRDAAKKKS